MPEMPWLSELTARLQDFLPELLAAAVLVLVGLLVALAVRFLAGRLLTRLLERARKRAEFRETVDEPEVHSTIPMIVAGFVFWVTWLFFLSAAIESLGFTVVTDVLSRVTYYLPDVFAAIVIVLAGGIIARVVQRAAIEGARSAGVLQAERVGRAAQLMVLVVSVLVALDQIGIDAQLLMILMAVLMAATFGSAGLAFGLGARVAVGNIIASRYVVQMYRVGQTVRIGEIEGEILQTTPTAVLLATAEGRMLVPARRFSEEPSLLLTQE
jgi:small-conductance mechanosensitive channel